MDRHPHHLDPIARLVARCRARGLPVTVQRRVVLEVLAARADHPTADDIYRDVVARLPGLARATVYRTLETLAALALITRVEHPSSSARFDARVDRHHHLTCAHCGRIEDLDDPSLDALTSAPAAASGYRVQDHSVHFRGICPACIPATEDREPPVSET